MLIIERRGYWTFWESQGKSCSPCQSKQASVPPANDRSRYSGTAVLTAEHRLPKYVRSVALPVPRLRERSSASSVAARWSDKVSQSQEKGCVLNVQRIGVKFFIASVRTAPT